jgi:hypothetical protein
MRTTTASTLAQQGVDELASCRRSITAGRPAPGAPGQVGPDAVPVVLDGLRRLPLRAQVQLPGAEHLGEVSSAESIIVLP